MDIKKVLRVITNKYFLTAVGFIAWTVFFDQNDWITLRQRQKELDGVKGNIRYLNTEIARMTAEKDGLLTDKKKLEEYAREHYHMRHDNEDVYVVDGATN